MYYVVIGFLEDSMIYYCKCGGVGVEYRLKIFLFLGLDVFIKFVVVGKYMLKFYIFLIIICIWYGRKKF